MIQTNFLSMGWNDSYEFSEEIFGNNFRKIQVKSGPPGETYASKSCFRNRCFR